VFGHKPASAGFGPLQNLISDLHLAGAYAAYAGSGPFINHEDVSTQPTYTVATWNLLTGKIATHPACSAAPGGPPGGGPAVVLALKSDGAVAWTCRRAVEGTQPTPAPPAYVEVHVADSNGARVVDQGTAIDPVSLALSAHDIYWSDNGQPRSAPIN
jgi:hypothetical protein